MATFLDATDNRRTVYTLQPSLSVPHSTIISLVNRCVLTVPSAFNSQATRITIFLGTEHQRVWELAGKALQAELGEESFGTGTPASPMTKLDGILNAYGSLFFWYDQSKVSDLKAKGGLLHGPKAEEWTLQSGGMHQYYLWTALEAQGLGANLQHWNPWIDKSVKEAYDLPESWVLQAQLIFGDRSSATSINEKIQQVPLAERVRVFNSQ